MSNRFRKRNTKDQDKTKAQLINELAAPRQEVIKFEKLAAERKCAEEALREEHEYVRNLINSSLDMIIAVDNRRRIMEFNPAAEETFRYSREEVLGKHVNILYADPKEGLALHKITIMNGHHVQEIVNRRKNGETFPCLLSASVLHDSTRGKVGVMGVSRDITERKRVEEELSESHKQLRSLSAHLQSIREEERIEVARGIHDDLGQELTALKMDLAWLKDRLRKDQESLGEKAASMSDLADSMILAVKRICAQLRPALLDDLGVVAALEWEVGEFNERTRIVCDLTVEPEEIDLDPDRSTAVYRILQEALTNITRHARATAVKASMKVALGKLEMEISDNGIGITEEQVTSPQSFGLIGIRERVMQWSGNATVKGRKGEGTTLTVTIPLDDRASHDD